MSLFSSFIDLIFLRANRKKLSKYDFGVIYFGDYEMPLAGYKHSHIGTPKLFYVDQKVLYKLSGKEDGST